MYHTLFYSNVRLSKQSKVSSFVPYERLLFHDLQIKNKRMETKVLALVTV